jgi:hypothetical protein
MVRLDVHKLFLKDAIDEILIKFDECVELGDNTLEIVHGHKHGTVIRDNIRKDGFLKEVNRNGYTIVGKNFSDKGATIFKLALSKKSLKKILIPKSFPTEGADGNKVQTDVCYKCSETMTLLKEDNWYQCPKCGKLKKR